MLENRKKGREVFTPRFVWFETRQTDQANDEAIGETPCGFLTYIVYFLIG